MMKTIFSLTALLAMAILFSAAISIDELPQDPPRGKKAEKHIKIMKVDDEGNKTEIDTVLHADQVFVWNGDTIDGINGMEWFTEGGKFEFIKDLDIDFDIDTDAEGKMFVLRSGNSAAPMVYEFRSEDDSTKEFHVKVIASGDDDKKLNVMKWHGSTNEDAFFSSPHPAHKMMVFSDRSKGNVIDLSDPGIVSFEKKELKDGKEKIVIVREKPSEEEREVHEEIIMHGAPAAATMFHTKGVPHKAKTIKVIAGDDGKVEIIENGKLMHLEEMEEGEKVIEKDGKKIVIKKAKKGDEVEVNVEVEEEKEEK